MPQGGSGGILVAVSGGADSVAMLHVLNDLRGEFDLHLEVAHVQHGIRGKAAQEDADFVGGLAKWLGLAFHLSEVDLPRLRRQAGNGNLEEMGRLVRYRYFAEVAHRRRLSAVATAHTLNDQAETFLMRLLRGSGRQGLSSMAPVRALAGISHENSKDLLLIRPLLRASREEIVAFLGGRKISYRTDSTNDDLSYLRNWTRLWLMPRFQEKFGMQTPVRLSAQAEILRDEEKVLAELTRENLEKITCDRNLERGPLLELDKAFQRRILRLWIERRRGHLKGIDFDHIEAALLLIAGGAAQARLALPGGWELSREYETLKLEKRARTVERRCYNYHLQVGTDVNVLEAGMTIHSELVSAKQAKLPEDFMAAVFDANLLTENLLVRNFRNGDRFQPLGMSGHKKVKDLFIERRLSLRLRTVLPLVVAGPNILWIPGHGRSEFARISSASKVALLLKAERCD